MNILTKRLLGLMQIGGRLTAQDGHIWIWSGEETECDSLENMLSEAGIYLNNKIYGGILEALDTIDEALRLAGQSPLIDSYYPEGHFEGRAGIDITRIRKAKEGNRGGLV